MGRVKLKIKRLENNSSRQVTYSKRKAGVMKKAKELSILCDIDLVLLMFAPNGKPTVCVGDRSNIEEVVARFSQVSQQERAKRKLESLEVSLFTILHTQTVEFQNDLHLHSGFNYEQGASPVSWLHNNGGQQLMLPQDSNLLSQR
ncbi:hypothetical protein B296_00026292 [Ensete ventricosum]|uniref:MADS-box domain-containing protein n=1 Tax=Ensete ventricosum TaxID=4639 RepID=A0A426ZS48_ENSVE|nr:hypothetical protein B296_00026292 [Ensete ventricosum]